MSSRSQPHTRATIVPPAAPGPAVLRLAPHFFRPGRWPVAYDPVGGMQNQVWQSTRDLDRAGIRQTVVTTFLPGDERSYRLFAATTVECVGLHPAAPPRPGAAERVLVRLHAARAGGPGARARRRARPPESLDLVPPSRDRREARGQAAGRHAERLAAAPTAPRTGARGTPATEPGRAARGAGARRGGPHRRADPATARRRERARPRHARAHPRHPRRDRRGRLRASRGRRGRRRVPRAARDPRRPPRGVRTSAGSATRRAGAICPRSSSGCRARACSSWCAATARDGDGSKGCSMRAGAASTGR